MTPAVRGAGIPSPRAIPIRAIPTVPDVPHELPVESETTEHMISVAKRKIPGLSIDSP